MTTIEKIKKSVEEIRENISQLTDEERKDFFLILIDREHTNLNGEPIALIELMFNASQRILKEVPPIFENTPD